MSPPSRATAGGSSSERPVQRVADVWQLVEPGDETPDERRLELVEHHADPGDGGERLPERDQVPRAGRAERRACDEALDVVNRLHRVAELRPGRAAEGEVLHGVEAILDAFERDQRADQPGAEQTAAHRRDRPIDLVEQRPRPPAVGGLDHLQVPQRRRIDQQAVGAGPEGEVAHVREVGLLGIAEVLHERAGRRHGGGAALETEALQRLRLQLREQRPARRLVFEGPRLRFGDAGVDAGAGEQRRGGGKASRREHFARPQHRELIGKRRTSVLARVLGRRELSGRQIEQRDAEPRRRLHRRERQQKRGLARLEIAGVGQRARRHDADDFAPHEALGLLRILHLFDDRDTKSLAHQPRDVAVGRVKRHAAHRDRAAGRILRPRGERQLERPRGGQRVLVEHLVEIAHAEEHDRVPVLTLRVEVLTHRRRRARRLAHGREGHGGKLSITLTDRPTPHARAADGRVTRQIPYADWPPGAER